MLLDTGAGQVCGAQPAPPSTMPLPSPPLPPLPPLSPGTNVTYTLDVLPESAGCPPVGPCLGFDGSCGDLPNQFATLAGCYVYGDPGAEEEHEFLDEYGMPCAHDGASELRSCLTLACRIQCATPSLTTPL